ANRQPNRRIVALTRHGSRSDRIRATRGGRSTRGGAALGDVSAACVLGRNVRSVGRFFFGEPAFGVDGCRTAGAGRGDGLAVGLVDQVARCEDAGDSGVRGGLLYEDVVLVVDVALVADQFAAGGMPGCDGPSVGREP